MTTDRLNFMGADEYPTAMDDDIIVNIMVDEDPMDPEEGMLYCGIIVEDPATDAYDSIWSVDTPEHWSGMKAREHIFDAFVVEMLDSVRTQHDREIRERAEWAARDTVTI